MSLISHITSMTSRIKTRLTELWRYASEGVWSDLRPKASVRLTKTLNLSVRAFFNSDIQTKACAMTYRTMLALVPALALIFAIGKGFGLQDVIKRELVVSFPSQSQLLDKTFVFVESYISQSSEGIFVGVGVVLLLWTLISILGSIEDAFNDIWGVKSGRSIWRKMTDYLAIFLILPVLMICASGITVFVSTAVESVFPSNFVTPTVTVLLDLASLVLIWTFFTGVYMLIPNTKVKFSNAAIAGVLAGTSFIILQWLFISGQVYVSKYNAIYGSFAFLPLFLIWLQLVWVICLAGAVICYASQNIFRFNFSEEISHISPRYRLKITVAVMAVIIDYYLTNHRAASEEEIANAYKLPSRLLSSTVGQLLETGLLLRVVTDTKKESIGYVPAFDPATLTIGDVVKTIRSTGTSDFIPEFDSDFRSIISVIDNAEKAMADAISDILVKDLEITRPIDATQNLKK